MRSGRCLHVLAWGDVELCNCNDMFPDFAANLRRVQFPKPYEECRPQQAMPSWVVLLSWVVEAATGTGGGDLRCRAQSLASHAKQSQESTRLGSVVTEST